MNDIAHRIAAQLPAISPAQEEAMWRNRMADIYESLAGMTDIEMARWGRACETSNAAFEAAVRTDFPYAAIVCFGEREVYKAFLRFANLPTDVRKRALTMLAARARRGNVSP